MSANPEPAIGSDWNDSALSSAGQAATHVREIAWGCIKTEYYLQKQKCLVPSVDQLRGAHQKLFGEVVPSAGRLRTQKGDALAIHSGGAGPEEIPGEIETLGVEMSAFVEAADRRPEDLCAAVAYYHARLIAIAPFDTGNAVLGRVLLQTQSEALGLEFNSARLRTCPENYHRAVAIALRRNDVGDLADVVAECSNLTPRKSQLMIPGDTLRPPGRRQKRPILPEDFPFPLNNEVSTHPLRDRGEPTLD